MSPRDLFASEAMRRARQHLAIDIGAKRALSLTWELIRRLRRLADMAYRDYGATIHVYTTNQTTAPRMWDPHFGIGVELRFVNAAGDRILADVQLFSAGEIRYVQQDGHVDPPYYSGSTRTDCLLRAIDSGSRSRGWSGLRQAR